MRCTDRVGKGVRTSPRDKLLARSADPQRLAEAYSFHRGMDHLGAAVGPLAAAALLFAWPGNVRLVFALAAIPGAVAVAALFAVRETGDVKGAAANPTTAAAVCVASGARARIPPRLLAANGTNRLYFQPGATVLHVVRAATSWPLGRLADRVGRRTALATGWFWYALCYLGFAAADAPWHAWALFASYGLVAGLTEGTERALVASAVPDERRGGALGMYNLISGAGLLVASVIAGIVWDRVSPAAALTLGAALAAIAAVLLRTRAGAQEPA